MPEALTRHRTFDSFRTRMAQGLHEVRVIDNDGIAQGFAMTKADELYQLYVSPAARGTGIARTLIGDAERRVEVAGYDRIWLACAIGNDRAARFYQKSGWTNVGRFPNPQLTAEGTVDFDVWRFSKKLNRRG